MTPLKPLEVPLNGLVLIEASAGTGKTYTISTLYLRLLLERGLEVDRILVVTFTQAATEELRDRIRRRVAQALSWLQGDIAACRDKDPTLADLLLALPDRTAATAALTDALTRMDEAAIHTIHGFCQRTLTDNAFESGAAFEAELITDETRLRATAAADFWRGHVAQADRERARWVREQWKTPQELLQDLGPTLALDDLTVLPAPGYAEQVAQELARVFSDLKGNWNARGDEVRALLETSPAINRLSYKKNIVARALAAAEAVASQPSALFELPPYFERLTPAFLAQKGTKPGHATPADPFFDLCARLQDLLAQRSKTARADFLITAREFLRTALDRRKRDEGLLYFDDLLRRMDRALEGQGAESLAAAIRQRYPVALIDEFQDTDPQQYRIFHRVYAGRADCGLFLIGDPKQAIYAFRGADIFTYMQARDDTRREGSQYTLQVNWRSGTRLLKGLNTLFESARRPFVYEPHIRFYPIAASEKADKDPLRVGGEDPVPLQFWMLAVNDDNQTKRPPGFIRKDAAQEDAARACAESIAGLLNRADSSEATLGDRPLSPGDIALLVRTHREGDLVQQALRACNVSSVTLSESSVFDSEDAEELATVLSALAAFNDEGLLRSALATSLLGRSTAELEALALDEIAWERVLARLQDYRELWQALGFMVAMQAMMREEEIPARLLQRPDGERRLTNLLQLIELLEVASRGHPGIDGLLRWLADQRAGDERDEARQLRLESDEGLVKVVTIHKSKGLEYPLVFVPFPWSFFVHRNRQQPPPFFHDPERKTAFLDLGSADVEVNRKLERTEQLAERLRLFYVAVTRAAKLCVLCWGRVNQTDGSALAYLLHPALEGKAAASRMAEMSEEEIRADLEALAAKAPECIAVCDLPKATGERWGGPAVDRKRLSPAQFGGAIDAAWRVSSYSALVRGAEAEQPDYDAVEGAEPAVDEVETPVEGVFGLPSGTHAGHFLHEVLEQLDFPEARGERLERTVRALLGRYGGLQTGRGATPSQNADWAPVVIDLVTQVLDTPLDDARSLRLRDIGIADRIPELEFHFPVAGLDPTALRRVLSPFAAYSASAERLGFEPMRGLMRGFVDLVFRHQGRFYIVDYKSNLLGRDLSAYGREKMREAIREHRYDLQYLIYTLALHRLLIQRVPGYDYERHFGGAYYLFLRGMRPAHGARYGIWYDRPERTLVQRLDRLFAGRAEAE
jgi:exodeoxyribonuclease V beta subunit